MTSVRAMRGQVERDAPLAGSSIPLYEQVYTALRATISDKPHAVGDALPSEAALARRFGVSRITIRHALQLLASEGFIHKRKARRTRISTPPGVTLHKQISSVEDIARGGADRRTVIKSFRMDSTDEQLQDIFGLAPKAKLRCLRMELIWQERLIGRSEIFFHPTYGRQLTRAHFNDVVFIFPVLQRLFGLKIAAASVQVSAITATAEDASLLKCPDGTALLSQMFIFRDEANSVVHVSRNRFIGEHYTLSYEVGRAGLSADGHHAMPEG